jgi:hypothetical protein
MKKVFFTAFFCLLVLSVSAQQGFKIGLRFSPIISYASILDSTKSSIPGLDKSAKIGFSYGLLANYGFTDNYAFHTGVHIVTKGYSTSTTTTTTNVKYTSVEIPIALKLRSNEVATGIYIKGLFGISADVNVGFKNEYTGFNPYTGAPGDGTIKDTKYINPFTTTFIFGPGAEWDLSFGVVDLGLIFHQGLMNINNKKQTGEGIIRVNYVSLDLGYYF